MLVRSLRSSWFMIRLQRDGLELEIGFVLELRVDRHQIVLAGDLQAVAGIEEQRHLGVVELTGELVDQASVAARSRSMPSKTSKPSRRSTSAMLRPSAGALAKGGALR